MSYETAKSLINRGYSRPTLYSVEIPNISSRNADYLRYFCKAVNIPGVGHTTATALGQIDLGVQEDIPTVIKFDRPVVLEVIENRDLTMYKMFRSKFDETAVQGANPTPGSVRTQRMKYYERYVFDMKINKLEYPSDSERQQYGMAGDPVDYYAPVMEFTFQNAYVTSLSELSLGSDRFNQVLTFQISFNFETYYYEKRDRDSIISLV